MGQRVVALAAQDPDWQVVAAEDSAQHPQLGTDVGRILGIADLGVALSAESATTPVDVAVDFSTSAGTDALLTRIAASQIPLVVATTGLEEPLQARIREVATKVPIVWAPSMSLAVNVALRLAEQTSRALASTPGGVDVEIIERHHRFKEDAPSGTALRFGEIIAHALDLSTPRHGRHGNTGPRGRHDLGYHAVRAGDNPGEHTLIFGMLGETLEITVRASDRDCYARGALAAAAFVMEQPPGLYDMSDVLGL